MDEFLFFIDKSSKFDGVSMPMNNHISKSVHKELLDRMVVDEKSKARKQGFLGPVFRKRLNRFQLKSKGWLTLTL